MARWSKKSSTGCSEPLKGDSLALEGLPRIELCSGTWVPSCCYVMLDWKRIGKESPSLRALQGDTFPLRSTAFCEQQGIFILSRHTMYVRNHSLIGGSREKTCDSSFYNPAVIDVYSRCGSARTSSQWSTLGWSPYARTCRPSGPHRFPSPAACRTYTSFASRTTHFPPPISWGAC